MGRLFRRAWLSVWLSAIGLWTASNVAAEAGPAASPEAPGAEEEKTPGKAEAEGPVPAKSQDKAKGKAKQKGQAGPALEAHSDVEAAETSRFMPIVSAGPAHIAISGTLP